MFASIDSCSFGSTSCNCSVMVILSCSSRFVDYRLQFYICRKFGFAQTRCKWGEGPCSILKRKDASKHWALFISTNFCYHRRDLSACHRHQDLSCVCWVCQWVISHVGVKYMTRTVCGLHNEWTRAHRFNNTGFSYLSAYYDDSADSIPTKPKNRAPLSLPPDSPPELNFSIPVRYLWAHFSGPFHKACSRLSPKENKNRPSASFSQTIS